MRQERQSSSIAGLERHPSLVWNRWKIASGLLGHDVRIGDAAQICASYARKQKTDKRDACHILKLLVEDRFPCIGAPDNFILVQEIYRPVGFFESTQPLGASIL